MSRHTRPPRRTRPPPVTLAVAPRPWLGRGEGECAYPVDGEGLTLRACCNPCGARTYCPAHDERMRGPVAPDAEALMRALEFFL